MADGSTDISLRGCASCGKWTGSRCGACESLPLCSERCAGAVAHWHAGGHCEQGRRALDARATLFLAASTGDAPAAASALATPGVLIDARDADGEMVAEYLWEIGVGGRRHSCTSLSIPVLQRVQITPLCRQHPPDRCCFYRL